jgi:hypothetical protein
MLHDCKYIMFNSMQDIDYNNLICTTMISNLQAATILICRAKGPNVFYIQIKLGWAGPRVRWAALSREVMLCVHGFLDEGRKSGHQSDTPDSALGMYLPLPVLLGRDFHPGNRNFASSLFSISTASAIRRKTV